jgi:hypothetical protein
MHLELRLNRARGQPDLPTDPARAALADQRQLDVVGVVERKPVEPGRGEIFAPRPRRYELGRRRRNLLLVHQNIPGISRAVWRQ